MSGRAARDRRDPHNGLCNSHALAISRQAHTRLPPSIRKSNADERRGAAAARLANDPSYTQTTTRVAAAELRSR